MKRQTHFVLGLESEKSSLKESAAKLAAIFVQPANKPYWAAQAEAYAEAEAEAVEEMKMATQIEIAKEQMKILMEDAAAQKLAEWKEWNDDGVWK